jgi:hypothetical protein
LGREFNERSMQSTSCCLNHFGIVKVPDTQKYRHLESDPPAVDLKGDTNLRIPFGSCDRFDASHFDFEFAHRNHPRRPPATPLDAFSSRQEADSVELGTWCWPRVVLIEKRPLRECERSSMNRAARSVGARRVRRLGATIGFGDCRMTWRRAGADGKLIDTEE